MINILLNGLRAGDKVAFKRLYEYYYPKLIGFSLRIVKSPELAADIVQDVFANLWDNRSSLPAEMNFNAYIYTLAKNRSINTELPMKYWCTLIPNISPARKIFFPKRTILKYCFRNCPNNKARYFNCANWKDLAITTPQEN